MIDAKKRDLKGNRIFAKEISKWSTKDNFIESANCLYAHISVAKKHMNTKLFIANGDEALNHVEKFCDNMYYNIILEILSSYCSEKAKTYSSFFIPKDGGTEMGLGNYLGKYKIFFSSIPKSFAIMEEPSESLTERQRIKNETIQETLKFQEEINNKAREANAFMATFSSIICTDSSVSDPLAISHGTFARNFLSLSAHFDSVRMFAASMNSKLSDLLQKYECRLSQIGCTQKPEFLSILSNILAQPDLDPLADLNEYEADSSILSIEDNLTKLNIDTDSMFIIEDLKTAEVEEDSPQLKQKRVNKKKKKKIKLNVAEAGDTSEDNEHGVKVGSIQTEQEIKSVASEVSSYVDDIQIPVSSGYVKDVSRRIRDMEKPLNQKVIPESNHSEAYKKGKGRKRENAHKAIASKPVMKSSSVALSVVALDVAPWITELMNAREYDFKRTIRILYRELSAMELQPEFITRNEKFVLGFISPLTKLPYAITHDIPHGSQLLKGNAAGWIKTIKRSLKEQAVIPS